MPRRSGDRERWRPDCGPDGAAPPGAEIGTSARLPVRIPLFQPRVESDDYLVETVHDEELDTASCVDLESTTGAPCKHVAHARSIGHGRRRDFATKNRQISPSEHPVEGVGHKAEMGSRQEQRPPTARLPWVRFALIVARTVSWGCRSGSGTQMPKARVWRPEGWHGARFTSPPGGKPLRMPARAPAGPARLDDRCTRSAEPTVSWLAQRVHASGTSGRSGWYTRYSLRVHARS